MFSLHPQLQSDTEMIGDLPLCRVLLMNDSQFPWVILVPRQQNISEIYQLNARQREQLESESHLISKAMMSHFNGDKLNLAALGNLVPQLHVHHIVRFQHDALWPQPVWGNIQAQPYRASALAGRLTELRNLFAL